MIKKEQEKISAIRLRKSGLSYNEILKSIPVSKSTLSVWLKDVGIAKRQKQRLTLKRKLAQLKAQQSCRDKRISKEFEITNLAKLDIKSISKNELLIIGAVLYWAEGSKQKKHNVSQGVSFGNSDPRMILLFIKWIQVICKCCIDDLTFAIYIHKSADVEKAKLFWENLIKKKISRIHLKNHNPKTNRKNLNENYFGLLRIDVKRSTDLNRKINGWVLGILDQMNIHTGV